MVAGELDDMTADDLQDFADHAFDTTYIKMIMAGNFYEQDALDTAKKVEEVLNSKPLPLYKRDEPLVPIFDTGHFVVMSSVPDENCRENAVICQFQCNIGFDPAQNCIRFLLAKILYEPFFDQLRTKEQLGYLVGVNGKRFQQAKGTISFGLQGSFNPAYMTMRINHFLRNYRQVLIDYEDAELDRTIQSITEAWKENHKSIPDEARAHWEHVVGGDYAFNYNRRNVDIMSKVTKQDLIEFWDKHINPATSPCYSRIDYQMWASTAYKPTTEEITSFPLAIIAIHGCLRQEGLDCISVSDVAGSIDAVGKSATVDDMLDYIKKLCLEVPDVDKVCEKISDIKSKARTAMEMALGKTNRIFKYPSARASELESIGMHQLQDGSWVVEDQKAFKSLYPSSNPTVPTRRLQCPT
ncbi:metalloprotease [Coemansia sp. RSA 486]|nr:metalloprotease [Coemansia sp. RSA 486]